ncbi:MAG: hypothetical protein U9O98_05355 [Asgard group archaeon]|nr:hypothetical protein [Asgard group archaeon]
MVKVETEYFTEEEHKQKEEMQEFKGKTLLIELAGGAILGGLSIILAVLVNPYMPTLPGLGIKFFDLIAIPMVFAFIVFGLKAGLLSTVIGCLGILILPEYMSWLGMIAKFTATLPMIIIPWLLFQMTAFLKKLFKNMASFEESSKNLQRYYPYFMGCAILVRVLFMFLLNLFVFIPLYSGYTVTVFTETRLALLYGLTYALWNIVQGFGDAYIPYLLAYPTRLVDNFSTW